ncbi:glycosyltransferase family 4 protein [Corynebacterium guangdongense]|uniref:Phosphatidylinositol alpha-mannosyltransferase n=1 Tax=Corynebacterium guangdongense TaxID=1783348 RepID=A0ABU1ZX07_9CORY|nr:glycosyltransferase family 4 protein [Corynebacterium guangdongense]MDR7329469.1 phosphatidylinositol alpha-mannosyltransferase [Corynebacterium guangdongense]WJZ18034.1 GDP-mannose-dependent alpha-(1-2)-phosphatidylinositol mannosyltransferase [Corynebacterium guangdongense]
MRIGIVCPYSFDEPGGVQAHILDLSRVLIEGGDHVEVIGPARATTNLPDFVTRGGRSVPVRYNGSVARLLFGPWAKRRMRQFIEHGRFDVLHIHEPNSPSYSMHALAMASGPIVATYHTSATRSRALTVFRPMLAPWLEKIRAGIAVSEMARRWQVEQLGGDPVLIPNGVDTRLFREARVPHGEGGPIEIVFLGRLDEPRKGLDILLRALTRVDRDVHVTVIGAGRQREADRVSYVGKVSDEEKARILGGADVYVAPNTGGESFGIVLVEAMAAGCAVVASDLEAFAAVVGADSETPAGLLFRTGSDADLAEKLTLLVDDRQLRRRLIDAGDRRSLDYDWSTVAKKVRTVYETVVDGTTVGVV